MGMGKKPQKLILLKLENTTADGTTEDDVYISYFITLLGTEYKQTLKDTTESVRQENKQGNTVIIFKIFFLVICRAL